MGKGSMAPRSAQALDVTPHLEAGGKVFQQRRDLFHLSQAEVGELAGLDRNTVSNAEAGESLQSRTLIRLAYTLHMAVGDIYQADPTSTLARAYALLCQLPPEILDAALMPLLEQWAALVASQPPPGPMPLVLPCPVCAETAPHVS